MKARFHYYSHRGRRKHPTLLVHHLGTHLVLPIALVVIAGFLATGAVLAPQEYVATFGMLMRALGASALRLLAAYLLALVLGVLLALLAERSKHVENFLLPVYDVLESLPILAFFPVIILFFLHQHWLEGAALFMLFFSMLWNIAFNAIGGFHAIPEDVKAVGKVFGLSAWDRFFRITLPALFPVLVTGSILALAQGWNILIAAEALHAYAPQSMAANDLFGIGSVLVNASSTGNTQLLLAGLAVLVVVIAAVNLLAWQPLLAHAERYKFE